jgi:hypothetical protein
MLDAFTAKEMVCFNTRVLDEHLPKAFDVVADKEVSNRNSQTKISTKKIRHPRRNPDDAGQSRRPGSRTFHPEFLDAARAWKTDPGHAGNSFVIYARDAR